jgi:uncharacterized membrane protein YvbJ
MMDAGLLGTQLGLYFSGKKTVQEAHRDYYAEMIPRGAKAVNDSHEAVEIFLANREKMVVLLQELDKKINRSH